MLITIFGGHIPQSPGQQAGLIRDEFGLHKIIVAATRVGKVSVVKKNLLVRKMSMVFIKQISDNQRSLCVFLLKFNVITLYILLKLVSPVNLCLSNSTDILYLIR